MVTLGGYLEQSRTGRACVLLTFPLFALYEAGLILWTSGTLRNAADVMMRQWVGAAGRSGGLVLNSVLLLVFLAVIFGRRWERRPDSLSVLALLGMVIAESTLYAMTIIPIVARVRTLVPLRAVQDETVREALVYGLGAGLYEEVLFRLVLIAVPYLLLRRTLGTDPIWAVVIPLIVSSLLFSAFHHFGALGEPWDPQVFAFRFLAGVFLGLLFVFRGFAVACWTHALYDTLWVIA